MSHLVRTRAAGVLLFAFGAPALAPATAAAAEEVCCLLDDGTTQYLSPRACAAQGVPVSDERCKEVCCVFPDGTTAIVTVNTCDAQGGQITLDEKCEERCNCDDDDGDGLIDEDIDCRYQGTLDITADDQLTGVWIDGVLQTAQGTDLNWQQVSSYPINVVGLGPHTIAITARDTQFVAQGFEARVTVPGIAASYLTGFGLWRLSAAAPPAGWETTGAGLTTLDNTAICPPAIWGGLPAALLPAAWVWDGGCDPSTDPRQNHGWTTFRACVAKVCCVFDDGIVAAVDEDQCAPGGTPVSMDLCGTDGCGPIVCPAGTVPVDTDGDGCDDDCA